MEIFSVIQEIKDGKIEIYFFSVENGRILMVFYLYELWVLKIINILNYTTYIRIGGRGKMRRKNCQ